MLKTQFTEPFAAPRLRALRRVLQGAWVPLWTALGITLFAGCTPPGPALLLEGKQLLDKGQPRAAIAPLRDAVEIMRTNGLAWSYLGTAYQSSGQLSNAATCYLYALRCDRDLIEVRYNLGQTYLALGHPDIAKPELTAFTLRQPKDLRGWLALGTAQLRTKDPSGALRSFSEALRLSSTNAPALNGVGVALVQRGRYREALPYLTAAVQQQPGYADALRNLATVQQVNLRDAASALQTWKQYAAILPPPPDLAAVQALIRQLETPPALPVVPTNLVAAASNAPATNLVRTVATNARPAATNIVRPTPTNVLVVTKPLPATNPSLVVVPPPASNPPVTARPVPVRPVIPPPTNPPLEVVTLTSAPPVQPARDLPATNPPAPKPVPPPTPSPTVAATNRPASSAPAEASDPAKRGFFARINPLNLFKKKPAEPKPAARDLYVTRLDTRTNVPAPVVTNVIVRSNAVVTAPSPAPAPLPPVGPRFTYSRAPAPTPGNRAEAEAPFRSAMEAQRVGRWDDALVEYRRATVADPAFFEAWNNLGVVAHELKKNDRALDAYQAALALKPSSTDARYNFAVALRDAGFVQDAANEFQAVLVSNPSDVQAQLALGNLYAQRLKQPARARPHYQRVLELDPMHPQSTTIRLWLRANPG